MRRLTKDERSCIWVLKEREKWESYEEDNG